MKNFLLFFVLTFLYSFSGAQINSRTNNNNNINQFRQHVLSFHRVIPGNNSSVNQKANGQNPTILNATEQLDSIVGTNDIFPEVSNRDWYLYDENHNVLSSQHKITTQGDSVQIIESVDNYSYDDAGRLIEINNISAADTTNSYKFSYTDGSDLVFSEIYRFKFDNEWESVYKTESYYNDEGRPVLIKGYDFDGVDWFHDWKYQMTYNNNGGLIMLELLTLNNDDWVLNAFTTYTYNDFDRIAIEISKWSPEFIGVLENKMKSAYNYTENNVLSDIIDFDWDSVNEEWISGFKTGFEYNTDYTMDELVLPYNDRLNAHLFTDGQLLVESHYSKQGGSDWVFKDSVNYYYSNLDGTTVVSVNEVESNQFKIYPNPVLNFLTIENIDGSIVLGMNYILFDINGKIIDRQQFPSNGKINVTDLDKGIYFLEILENNQRIFSQKIIKQ